MRTVDSYTPSFGSSHDPVLHGVACGLADLFQPVEHPPSLTGEHPPSLTGERQDELAFTPDGTSEEAT
jgi:hypothetical protein